VKIGRGQVAALLLFASTPALAPSVAWADTVLFEREDPGGLVTLVENDDATLRRILVDGRSISWTGDGADRRAQTPFVLYPGIPKTVFVGGLVNGAPIGAALMNGATHVDVAEANQALAAAIGSFGRLMERDDVVYHPVAPATWFKQTDSHYDLIYLNGGALSLTPDDLTAAKKRLAPGGMVALWIPLGALDAADRRRAISRFMAAFSHVTGWFANLIPQRASLLLTGSVEPLPFDAAKIADRLERLADTGAFLEKGNVGSFLSFFITDRDGLAPLAEAKPSTAQVIWRYPYDEGGFGRSLSAFNLFVGYRAPVTRVVAYSGAEAAFSGRSQLIRAKIIDLGGRADKIEEALDAANAKSPGDPHVAAAYLEQGTGFYRTQVMERAARLLEKARDIAPDEPAIRYILGKTYEAMRRYAEANREFATLDKLAPDYRHPVRIEADRPASE
jgi:tetratricopeptide (TPR) repeat protein